MMNVASNIGSFFAPIWGALSDALISKRSGRYLRRYMICVGQVLCEDLVYHKRGHIVCTLWLPYQVYEPSLKWYRFSSAARVWSWPPRRTTRCSFCRSGRAQGVEAALAFSTCGKPGLYGAFVWAHRALNSQNWRFLARVVRALHGDGDDLGRAVRVSQHAGADSTARHVSSVVGLPRHAHVNDQQWLRRADRRAPT